MNRMALLAWVFLVSNTTKGFFQEVKYLITKVEEVSAEVLRDELASDPEIILINVLSQRAHKDCRIHRSVSIPFDHLKRKVKDWPRDRKIVVHCASYSCPLSRHAYRLLTGLGFSNVRAYEGGLREWMQKGYSVRGKCRAGYLRKDKSE